MSDKKNEAKKNGLRGIFRRKSSSPDAPKPTQDAESKPQEQSQRPPARRTYTPRYAERDMILSVPVEDRPDLVAKVKEHNLKRVCSDIGFSTGSSSRASSSHARSSSLKMNALSTHPNLHISRHAALNPSNPGSSSSSIRSIAMNRYSSAPAVPLQQSADAMDMQWRGLSYNGPPSFIHRPRPRATQSMANIPQMIPESQTEHTDFAYRSTDVSEDSDNADNDTSSRASTPSSGYTPEIGRRPIPSPVRQRSYFSHRGPLPNLRTKSADKGKGKEQASEWNYDHARAANMYNRPVHRASYESMSDYEVNTTHLRASQTAPGHLPPPPPPSNSGSSESYTPSNPAEHSQESRTPSVTESESYATDSSYHEDSARTSSVSTVLTAPTDNEEDVKTEVAVKLDDASDGKDPDTTPCAEQDGFDLHHVQTAETTKIAVESQ